MVLHGFFCVLVLRYQDHNGTGRYGTDCKRICVGGSTKAVGSKAAEELGLERAGKIGRAAFACWAVLRALWSSSCLPTSGFKVLSSWMFCI